jgi:hypothetical protein
MKAMRTPTLVSFIALAALAGCGSSTATQLQYTDPKSSDWRLVKDPATTKSRLVLALVGPSGTTGRGVGFNLQAGTAARWSTFQSGLPVDDAGVFELLNSQPDPTSPDDPILLDGGVMEGNILTVGIFQKDRRVSAKDVGSPLLRIAIELGANAKSGAIPLQVLKAKMLPGDIGNLNSQLDLFNKSHLNSITIALGTLQAS